MIVDLDSSVTIRRGWASDDEIAAVRELAKVRKFFQPTGQQVSPKFRQADVVFFGRQPAPPIPPDIAAIWRRAERQAVADYNALIWTDPLEVDVSIPPQVTMSGNGQFYRTHTDNGQNKAARVYTRTVTYIVYCGGDWTGGDLVLHPTRKHGYSGKPADGEPLRIRPELGDLVTFPSLLRHEVETVATSGDWLDGRLTLNGWVHRVDPQPGLVRKALQKARLGDKIAAVTNAAGIRQCGACKRRQAVLNGE